MFEIPYKTFKISDRTWSHKKNKLIENMLLLDQVEDSVTI